MCFIFPNVQWARQCLHGTLWIVVVRGIRLTLCFKIPAMVGFLISFCGHFLSHAILFSNIIQYTSFGKNKKHPIDSDLEFQPPKQTQHTSFGNNKKRPFDFFLFVCSVPTTFFSCYLQPMVLSIPTSKFIWVRLQSRSCVTVTWCIRRRSTTTCCLRPNIVEEVCERAEHDAEVSAAQAA